MLPFLVSAGAQSQLDVLTWVTSGTKQEVSTREFIQRLQESVTLVNSLQEVEVLKGKLREVRDLEERLQDIDELAERVQKIIENQLGQEEVDRLRAEEELEQRQIQSGPKVVVRRSVRRMESTEGDVDELEEQIKQVFFKDLPDDEGGFEVTEENRLAFSSREKLRQIEKELQEEVRKRFGAADATSAVAYQKMMRMGDKQVIIVEQGGQAGAQEDWFKLFDRPSYFTATGKVCCANCFGLFTDTSNHLTV